MSYERTIERLITERDAAQEAHNHLAGRHAAATQERDEWQRCARVAQEASEALVAENVRLRAFVRAYDSVKSGDMSIAGFVAARAALGDTDG